MEFYQVFGNFVGILRESIKVLTKNGEVKAFIITISILLNSLILFTQIFSTKSLFRDLLAKQNLLIITSPSSPDFVHLLGDVKEDIQVLLGIGSSILLAFSVVSLSSMTSMVLLSAMSYVGKSLSFKDLLPRLARPFIRSLITSFYVTSLIIGYIFFVSSILIALVVINADHPLALKSTSIVFGILAMIVYIYLSVVLVLAFVISVIEESCYGIEALGKAGGLVKGKRLHGFALNFLFALVSMIIFQGTKMVKDQKSASSHIIIGGFFLTVFSCLVMMFHYVTYTVLYFQCKKIHGEEIELQGSMEYIKVPSMPIVSADIP